MNHKILISCAWALISACQTPVSAPARLLTESSASSPPNWIGIENSLQKSELTKSKAKRQSTLLNLSHQLVAKERLEEAELILDELAVAHLSFFGSEIANLRGLIAVKRGDAYAAEKIWKEALTSYPQQQLIKRNLGYFYLSYGQFEKTISLYSDEPSDFHSQLQSLIARRNLQQIAETDRLCEKLLEKYPSDTYVLYNCSLHEFQNNKHASRAIELMNSCIAQIRTSDGHLHSAYLQLENMKIWLEKFQK